MKRLLVLFILILCASGTIAQQRIVLNDPVQERSGVSEFQLNSFSYNRIEKRLIVELVPTGSGNPIVITYDDAEFDNRLSKFINTALERKIIQQLQSDGKLGPGTVGAAP